MPRKSKKNPDNLSPETVDVIKVGCEQSNAGKVSEVDFSEYANEADSDDDEGVICPICGHKCLSDPDTHCKHVVFVVVEKLFNSFWTTTKMDEWINKNVVGDGEMNIITDKKLTSFCKKFGIKRETMTHQLVTMTKCGMFCGPVSYEFIFGFGE